MQTTINYTERLEALVARREVRNPGLSKVRNNKYGKKTIHLWDFYMLPTKQEMLDSIK